MADVELKRGTGAGLASWLLVDDAENTDTALSDPVIDYGARARLDALLTELAGKLSEGGTVALDAPTLAALEEITAALDAARVEIGGLSFSETLAPLGSHQTAWVDVRAFSWLDITTRTEAAGAFDALIEFTNAADPNTTPPTASEIIRPLTTTIGGSALGGIDDPSFGIPAQAAWARITLTDLTGGQDVVVSTFGQALPATNALLPIDAEVTGDFRATLTRAIGAGTTFAGDFANLQLAAHATDENNRLTAALTNGTVETFSVDTGTDEIIDAGHGLGEGDAVVLTTTGTLPDPLEALDAEGAEVVYWVTNPTANRFQLTSNPQAPSAIDLTDAGSGTHSYQQRGQFLGSYEDYSQVGHGLWFYFSDVKPAALRAEWSSDGATPDLSLLGVSTLETAEIENAALGTLHAGVSIVQTMIRPFRRMRIVNGPADMTPGLFDYVTFIGREEYPGSFGALDANLSDLSTALLTRAVQAGTAPDGSFSNLALDGTLASDSFEDSGSLPSGALPAFDPVGPIAAANVIDTGWMAVSNWNFQSFHALFDIAGVKVFLLDASDDQGNNSITTSFSFPTATSQGAGRSIEVGAEFFNAYFRIIIVNDSGSPSNAWSFRSRALAAEPGGVTLSLDQPILEFVPAPIIQAITKGQQPDGNYVAAPQSGSDAGNTTTTPLAAGAEFVGTARDTTGFLAGMIVVESDEDSAPDGVKIEFAEDEAFTFVHREISFSYTAGSGEPRFFPVTQGEYYRVRFLNNATTPQARLLVRAELLVTSPQAMIAQIAADLDSSQLAQITRSILAGESAPGVFENVGTDGSGRLLTTSGSEFARLLARQVEDTDELRLDVEPSSDDFYIGKATDGESTATADWDVIKIALSATRNPERIQFRQGLAWDDRANAGNWT